LSHHFITEKRGINLYCHAHAFIDLFTTICFFIPSLLGFATLQQSSKSGPAKNRTSWTGSYAPGLPKLAQDSSLNTIAHNFSISIGTVHNVLKCFTLIGDIAAKAPCPQLGSRKLSVTEELL